MDLMRANGHDPCVVVQTSPGHLPAWIHLRSSPLEPALATAVMAVLVLTLQSLISGATPVVELITEISVGAAAYTTVIALLSGRRLLVDLEGFLPSHG